MSQRVILKKGVPTRAEVLVVAAKAPASYGAGASRRRRASQDLPRLLGEAPEYVAASLAVAEYEAERFDILSIPGRDESESAYTLVVGLGADNSPLTAEDLRRLGGVVAMHAERLGAEQVAMLFAEELRELDGSVEALEAFTEGFLLGAYRYSLRTNAHGTTSLRTLDVWLAEGANAASRAAVQRAQDTAEGVALARDLVNAPPNYCTPVTLEETAKQLAEASGKRGGSGAKKSKGGSKKKSSGSAESALAARVLQKAELERLGFGGLLAVNQGADIPARLICLEYSPGAKRVPTVCFVGKGITFDTGGYSLKPSDGQVGMKADMAGAAAVLGLMNAVGRIKPKLRVVGLVPATQNFINGSAYTVDDVLTMYSGKTVEVGNTDAEGRLILADALSYACQSYTPDYMFDFATLTGACTIALGKGICAALLTRDDEVASFVEHAGRESGERVWRLPLWDEYRELLRSKVADIRNTGGRPGGTISAAKFLEEFVTRKETRWAHVDMASMAMMPNDQPHGPQGATGFGVRLGLAILREIEARK